MPGRATGGQTPLKLSERQLERIRKLRSMQPKPMAWDKIVGELSLGITGERLRTLCRDAGMDTSDGRTQHIGVHVPWTVRPHHQTGAGNGAVYTMLKRRSFKLQGRPLAARDQEYLDNWLRWMDGANEWGLPLAVHYNPESGFTIRPRRPRDDGPISPPPELKAV